MSFENAKLRGRIVEICGSQSKFAELMGVSEHTISKKVSGKIDWRSDEILKAAEVLKIENEDIHLYFFTLKVQY